MSQGSPPSEYRMTGWHIPALHPPPRQPWPHAPQWFGLLSSVAGSHTVGSPPAPVVAAGLLVTPPLPPAVVVELRPPSPPAPLVEAASAEDSAAVTWTIVVS